MNVRNVNRPSVTSSWKVVVCAAWSLALTATTMLAIGDVSATRLFVHPTVVAQGAPSAATDAFEAVRR